MKLTKRSKQAEEHADKHLSGKTLVVKFDKELSTLEGGSMHSTKKPHKAAKPVELLDGIPVRPTK